MSHSQRLTVERLRVEVSAAYISQWPRLDQVMSLQPFPHASRWLSLIEPYYHGRPPLYWNRLLWVLARRFSDSSVVHAYCGEQGIIFLSLQDSQDTVLLMNATEATEFEDTMEEPVLFWINEMPLVERDVFARERVIAPFVQSLSARERLSFFASVEPVR